MDFETLDWELEARRVKAAFGVKSECKFYEFTTHEGLERRFQIRDGNEETLAENLLVSGESLRVYYAQGERFYEITNRDRRRAHITFWDEQTIFVSPPLSHVRWGGLFHLLIKGVYYLDLLTPHIETELEISISAHEKLEWKLEYEERYDL